MLRIQIAYNTSNIVLNNLGSIQIKIPFKLTTRDNETRPGTEYTDLRMVTELLFNKSSESLALNRWLRIWTAAFGGKAPKLK